MDAVPPPIIDTHAHLDDPAFDEDRSEILAQCARSGVQSIVNIGLNPASWERSRDLRECFPQVELAIGLHPMDAAGFGRALADSLARAVEVLRPVGIGETGLDFSRARPGRVEQELAFRAQLELATALRLPVIIHQRNAGDAVTASLDRFPDLASIVLHSFDGNQRLMDWALERGCYLGVGGLALKPAAVELRGLLPQAPTARLVLETDSPYLAPRAARSRRNTPANLPMIAEALAPLWGIAPDELRRTTTRNAVALFGLDRGRGAAVTEAPR